MDQEEKKIINEVVDTNGLEPKEGLKISLSPKEEHRSSPGSVKERIKNSRKIGARTDRVRPEFDQKLINIRRVARVVSGGRRFSFSVALIAGNRKGSVGVGIGKAGDTSLAIDKAMRNAKKNMINVNLTKSMSIPHEADAKYSSAKVVVRPAHQRGIIAGSAARSVIDLAGIKDVSVKVMSVSKNKLNIARATIEALKNVSKLTVKGSEISGQKEEKKVSKEAVIVSTKK